MEEGVWHDLLTCIDYVAFLLDVSVIITYYEGRMKGVLLPCNEIFWWRVVAMIKCYEVRGRRIN